MRMLLFTTGAKGHDVWSSGESGQPLWIVTGHSTLFSTESGVHSTEVRGAWGKHTCEELEVGAVITERTPMELNMTNMHMLFSLQSLHSLAQSIWHKFPFLEVTVGLVLCKLIDSFDSFVQALVMTGNIECCI